MIAHPRPPGLRLPRPVHRARVPAVHQQLSRAKPLRRRSPRSSASPRLRAVPRLHPRAPREVEHEATDSTAEAVRRVSRVDRPWAAIGTAWPPRCTSACLAPDIEDSNDNRTRFVFVARARPPRPRGYKTSIVCGIANDQPGSLLLILSEFAFRSSTSPRSSRDPPSRVSGDYVFFIDMEGAPRPGDRAGPQVPGLQAALAEGAGLLPGMNAQGGSMERLKCQIRTMQAEDEGMLLLLAEESLRPLATASGHGERYRSGPARRSARERRGLHRREGTKRSPASPRGRAKRAAGCSSNASASTPPSRRAPWRTSC